MAAPINSAAPHSLPIFVTPQGETDVLMVVTGILLLAIVFGVGILFLRIHTLPERMAHKSQKMQFEIVAVLGLIALFTHIHLFWVAGLILAMIDLPDWGTSLSRIAGSSEKIAGISRADEKPADEPVATPADGAAAVPQQQGS